MIRLTRLNRAPLVVNSDLIEHVENTPDTVIFMTTGQKFVVLETPDAVIEKIREFRRSIGCEWRMPSAIPPESKESH
jgi:flagellar protein FlbD